MERRSGGQCAVQSRRRCDSGDDVLIGISCWLRDVRRKHANTRQDANKTLNKIEHFGEKAALLMPLAPVLLSMLL